MPETTIAGKDELNASARRPARVFKLALWLLITVIVVAAVIIWGIDARIKTAAAVKQETIELALPTVGVAHPKLGAMENEIALPGSIQAFMESPVSARASGYLKKWYADIGAHVKAGQTLAEIDAPELDQQVHQAEADLQQVKAALDQASANLQQGKANAELARVTAQRWSNLVAKGVVSKQENDQYQAQYHAQTASVDALEKAVAAAQSNIASSEANVSRLQNLQDYKTIKAPFDGVITARNTDVGALVNASGSGPSAELFHLAATATLRVFVSVPQIYSQAAVPGIKAELTLAEFPGRRFPGKLVRTAESMDAGTRTLLSEIDIANPMGELKPGSYAQVHLELPSRARALVVPVGAVLFRSEGLRVGVVRDEKRVELVPVVLGKDFGTEVEVLSGIKIDDWMILNPADSLTSGAEVRPVRADQPRR